MQLHLFGAATPTGEAFRQLAGLQFSDMPLLSYSRQSSNDYYLADFRNPSAFQPAGDPGIPAIWVSFAPIWLLASFLDHLASHNPNLLLGTRGLIACSSTSVITKRFAANRFDQELVARITAAEGQLFNTCCRLQLSCRIVRPTLIYGQIGPFVDSNLSRLVRLMRCLPFLILPAESGLRQPIHASQLAAVAIHLVEQLIGTYPEPSFHETISVGGDTTLSYAEMIRALQQAQPDGDPARRCRLLLIPNRLFFSMGVPLLLRSPKAFESVLRMSANLSGFTPAHQFLAAEAKPFPVFP